MDEQVRSKGLIFQAIIYFFFVFPMGALGVGALASYPDQVWMLGLLFTTSSLLFLYSGISNIIKLKKKNRDDKMKILELEAEAFKQNELKAKAVSSSPSAQTITQKQTAPNSSALTEEVPASSAPQVLANWSFSPAEWKKFQGSEKIIITRDTVLLIALITVVGGWIFHDDKGESWTFSLTFCFVFAVFFFLLKNFIKKGFFTVNEKFTVQVVVDMEKVMINGRIFYFRNAERWLMDAYIIETKGGKVIEIEYGWNTRGGDTSDEVRIPIPADKEDEAVRLVGILKQSR